MRRRCFDVNEEDRILRIFAIRTGPVWDHVAMIVEIVLALVVVMIVLPVFLFAGAQRWAMVSPRFGRWLDRTASRLSPRLGRWVSDPTRDRQDTPSSDDRQFDA